jgi:hypothetical protein
MIKGFGFWRKTGIGLRGIFLNNFLNFNKKCGLAQVQTHTELTTTTQYIH